MNKYVVTAEVMHIGYTAHYTKMVDAVACANKLVRSGASDVRINGKKIEEV